MIKTEAQNQYFEALNAIANTGADDIKIDTLLDNMFAEFDHNIIELSYKNSYDLLTIIGKRFNTVKKNRLFENDHALKFKKLLDSRAKEVTLKSFKGINKYGTERSPSGLIIPKQKPKNLSDEFKESSKTNNNEPLPENFIDFDNTAQKYLLLEELGIIGFLNEKYTLSSQTKKGLLLAYITNTKKGKPFENVLSAVHSKNKESDYYPFKEKHEIKVNRILADIGIEKKTTIAAIKKK